MARFTNEEFEMFKTEFIKWQERFGLIGYTVYFRHEPTHNCYADITVDNLDLIATVRLSNAISDETCGSEATPQREAKHEALHLLLSALEYQAKVRYVTEAGINRTVEELVHKLERLIG